MPDDFLDVEVLAPHHVLFSVLTEDGYRQLSLAALFGSIAKAKLGAAPNAFKVRVLCGARVERASSKMRTCFVAPAWSCASRGAGVFLKILSKFRRHSSGRSKFRRHSPAQAKMIRKPGKNRVVLRLIKADAGKWPWLTDASQSGTVGGLHGDALGQPTSTHDMGLDLAAAGADAAPPAAAAPPRSFGDDAADPFADIPEPAEDTVD